ncbi:hypothetical protein [Streptomyces sp. NPDC059802]|uniref:hypothetical protein n=1 Tax=Streptomyces sp. NPDC059802 TaxID=3346952 RepID=UPI0036663116
MVSKKDRVPRYQPQEPQGTGPSRNDILDRYGLGGENASEGETDAEREMREWEEAQAAKLEGGSADQGPSNPRSDELATQGSGDLERADEDDEDGRALPNLPAHADAHGYVAIPAFAEPSSEDPKERLEHYLRGIGQVEYAAKSTEQRVQQQRLLVLGEYIQAMKDERAWEVGGYTTLGDLLFEQFGIRKDYANKVVRAVPVVRALEKVTTMDLKERQLRVLVPIQRDHGDEAVQKVWEEASRRGKLTEKTLEAAAKFLGFGVPVPTEAKVVKAAAKASEPDAGEQAGGGAAGSGAGGDQRGPLPYERVNEACVSIRELRSTDEERAKAEVRKVWAAVDELRRELGIEIDAATL